MPHKSTTPAIAGIIASLEQALTAEYGDLAYEIRARGFVLARRGMTLDDVAPIVELPHGGSHAPWCPYHAHGECLCWRSDPLQNPELLGELAGEAEAAGLSTADAAFKLGIDADRLNNGGMAELLRLALADDDVAWVRETLGI